MFFCNFSFWFAFDLKNNRKSDTTVANTNFGCINIAFVQIKIAKISAQTTNSGRLILRWGLENE